VVAILHWPVAILLALGTPFLPANMRLAGMATEDASRKQLEEVRQLSYQLLDRFRGMRTLVTLGAVERERRVVQQACDSLNRATTAVLRRAFIVAGVLDAVITCSIAVCATYVGLVLLGYLHLPWMPGLGFGVCSLSEPRVSLPDTALIVLLAAGVLELIAILPLATQSARDAIDAAGRIAVLAPPAPVSAAGDVSVVSASGGLSVQVSGLPLAPGPASGIGRLDLEFGAGELLVVSGRSGSGKTTLLRALAGELAPTTGPPRSSLPSTTVTSMRWCRTSRRVCRSTGWGRWPDQ
jgi:ATP-binding cassette, subfamily C, bacterial CydD